jgi:hypothetical protein
LKIACFELPQGKYPVGLVMQQTMIELVYILDSFVVFIWPICVGRAVVLKHAMELPRRRTIDSIDCFPNTTVSQTLPPLAKLHNGEFRNRSYGGMEHAGFETARRWSQKTDGEIQRRQPLTPRFLGSTIAARLCTTSAETVRVVAAQSGKVHGSATQRCLLTASSLHYGGRSRRTHSLFALVFELLGRV